MTPAPAKKGRISAKSINRTKLGGHGGRTWSQKTHQQAATAQPVVLIQATHTAGPALGADEAAGVAGAPGSVVREVGWCRRARGVVRVLTG